ncbi:MAG: ATP-binding protein [Candidatus Omnitrophota bacterium]|nr:ATP-binding protein [Candidatus Omnitrophota bacterium]
MSEKVPFIQKLLKRLDRVDRVSLETYLLSLAGENESLREVLDRIEEGVMILGDGGGIEYVNRRASLALGLREAEGKGKTRNAQAIRDKALSEFIERNRRIPKDVVVEDVQVLIPQENYFRVYLSELEGSPGRCSVILVNLTDIRNCRFDDEQLARIETLIRLTAGIAHEIGNPLNSIGIHIELLKREVGDLPQTKRARLMKTLDVLSSETSRLDRIIRNFLRATRKPPLRFRSENLGGLVAESVEVMKPELGRKKISVRVRKDPKMPEFYMDRERLSEVFINLIKNAMEAMKAHGTLKISVENEGKAAVVRFADTGCGIREEDLLHIFEPYFTTKEDGSGLGLMSVYQAVREHGGRIDVATGVGKGTTFTLVIPMRQPKLQIAKKA